MTYNEDRAASIMNSKQAMDVGLREDSRAISFVYRNWKGEVRERKVVPLEFVFGCDNYHRNQQWLMHAIDCEKNARRTFAFEDILTPIRKA